MDNQRTTNARIREFIVKKFPAARKNVLTDDQSLLGSGIIDSLGVLDLVTFLERSFKIKVSDEELTPDNFASVQCLASFVTAKTGQARVSV